MSSPRPPAAPPVPGARGTRAGTFPVSQLGAPIFLFQRTNQTIAASGIVNLLPVSPSPIAGYAPCNQIGYEINAQLTAAASAGNTAPFLLATATWYDDDSLTALPVDSISWYLPVNSPAAATAWPLSGHGYIRGQYMSLQLTNLDPTIAATYTVLVRGTSRTFARDDWRWLPGNGAVVPGYTIPITGAGRGTLLVAAANPTVNQGASAAVRLLPLVAGKVRLSWSATGLTAAAAQVTVAPVNSTGATPPVPLYVSQLGGVTPASGAPPSTLVDVPLGRDCCTLTMANVGAVGNGNAAFDVTIMLEEY